MATRQDYIDQAEANLGYRSDPTGAKALAFIEACEALRLVTPSSSASAAGGLVRYETGWDLPSVNQALNQAERWLAANVTRSVDALIATAQVPRQFGFNRMRNEYIPEQPPQNAEVH